MKKSIFFAIAAVLIFINCSTTRSIPVVNDYSESIALHRQNYKHEFTTDERSPLKEEELQYLTFYDADIDYACTCNFTATPDAKPFNMATYSGEIQTYQKYGLVTCPVKGIEVQLFIYFSPRVQNIPGYSDHLFLPFKDYTNGESSYGGGRYIDLKKGDIIDNKVVIDFNKCYNPWCAYSDGYSCPVPPSENHLAMSIFAGEKNWTREKKK